ncbi:MAG: cytochrome c5 [Cryomorphaceae bacterium]|jgi:cytochrome c5
MSEEQMNDSTFSRLFIIMMIVLAVLTIAVMVAAKFASSGVNERLDARYEQEGTQSIADRLAPVGNFSADIAAAPAAVAAATLSGKQAYASCSACHTAGIAGAPALGDSAQWVDRVAQGIDQLYDHAINGYQGSAGYMPAKGGNVSLSDDSVKAAVDYMVDAAK